LIPKQLASVITSGFRSPSPRSVADPGPGGRRATRNEDHLPAPHRPPAWRVPGRLRKLLGRPHHPARTSCWWSNPRERSVCIRDSRGSSRSTSPAWSSAH